MVYWLVAMGSRECPECGAQPTTSKGPPPRTHDRKGTITRTCSLGHRWDVDYQYRRARVRWWNLRAIRSRRRITRRSVE